VLSNYDDPDLPPQSPGRGLRRTLANLQIRPDASGRLHSAHVEPIRQAASQVEGIWPTGRLRVFISHVTEHKDAVGALATELSTFGLSCFVAHDAIEPTRE